MNLWNIEARFCVISFAKKFALFYINFHDYKQIALYTVQQFLYTEPAKVMIDERVHFIYFFFSVFTFVWKVIDLKCYTQYFNLFYWYIIIFIFQVSGLFFVFFALGK